MTDKNQFKKLEDLWETIQERVNNSSPKDSYVSSLFSKGIKECAKKLGEEAVETSLAALSKNKEDTVKEFGKACWLFINKKIPIEYMHKEIKIVKEETKLNYDDPSLLLKLIIN